MTILIIVSAALTFTTTYFALDSIRLRRQLRRELRVRAEEAARALGDGMVRIEGHVLPDPEDLRWRLVSQTIEEKKGKRTETMFSLGAVCVEPAPTYLVYVRGPGAAVPPLVPSAKVMQYGADVWRAQRNRLVRAYTETK